MPFHDYSSLVRTKGKDQPCRHSSPPIYDLTKNTKVNAHDTSQLIKGDPTVTEKISSEPVLISETKLDSSKPPKTPFRSNSNPACFDDYSKAKKDLRGYPMLDRNKNQSLNLGIENPNFGGKVETSEHTSTGRRYFSFSGSSSNNVIKEQNGNQKPSIVVDKPPTGSLSSPSSGVKLRLKATNSPKSHRKRRGIIVDNNISHSISSPVLISHQSSNEGVQLRDIEQQEELLTQLQIQPKEAQKKPHKSQTSPQESNSIGTRMTERIQRTIRALYTSNSSPKREAFSLLDESNDSADELVSGKPPSAIRQSQYARLQEASPKSDKKVSRKRSPKPNVKNNLQVKDVDGSRRFKWRGSVNKIVKKFGTGQPFLLNGTFGVHLEDCPPSPVNEFVPYVVELCCRIMEDRGLHTTGIYRVPGNNAALLALQEDLNIHSVEMLRPDDERLRDLNIVSSLLKSFFRKLPEPMFTNELYHDFVQANRSPTSESRLNGLRRLVHMLPGPHYETLKFLISHLRLIADNCGENKMEVRNLAIVFGPTLVRNTAADNTATMVTDMSDQCRIIESIIEHAEWFFSDAFDPAIEEPNVPGVPTEREHEAVPNIEFLLENVGRKPGDTGNTSESTKSKASDDSEKDSFSRDLVEMFFGKKWRQANQANQPATVEDHGGFEDYEYRRRQETTPKKEETSSENIEPPKSPDSIQVSSIPNVSERLLQFYNEHLERLSQTTIGLTFPAFSSADSSPRTTPRHSTILNAPLVFPTPGQARNFGSRNRINSDQSQDGRYGVSSVEIHPSQKTPPFPLPEALGRSKGVPQYKHPPNPYNKGVSDATPKQTISSRSTTTFSNSSALNTPATTLVSDSNRGKSQNNSTSPGVKMRKHSSSKPLVPDIATNVRRNLKENYPDRRVQNMAPAPSRNPALTTNEDKDTPPMNERLVGELPKTVHPPRVSSPTTLRGNRSPKQPTKSKSEHVDIKRKTSSSSIQASEDNRSRQNTKEMTRRTDPDLVADSQQKRRKSPLKENVVVNKSIPERTFSRYDPKRRGIRFAGTENEPTNSGVLTSSPAKHLTATERLFNTQQQQQQQPIRRRLSVREHKKNSVIRRHTLSGIQDLEEHSPLLANKSFKSNLKQVAMGQNLSMYDITTISGPGQSAMERLNPKGASRGMTLSNWIVRERVRNKTVQRNGCPMGVGGGKPALSKKDKLKDAVRVHSYV